jgi:FdrA protein
VLRGAFAGGTLCDEAMVIAAAAVGPVASNIPLEGAPRLDASAALDLSGSPAAHAFVDFGDDDLTRGRPHPMIDGSLRAQWIARTAEEAGDGDNGVVLLLDVVLGHGAHPDPAADLAPAIAAARGSADERGVDLAVVVSLCGSGSDPQGLERQADRLREAGASVHLSNAVAARTALELLADEVRIGAATSSAGGR